MFAVLCFSLFTAIYALPNLTMCRPYPGWRKKCAFVGPLTLGPLEFVVVLTERLCIRVNRDAMNPGVSRGCESQARIQGYADPAC